MSRVPRGRLGCLSALPVVLLLAAVPYGAWWLQPVRSLRVLVVDKTVPAPTYREHKGLMWVMNHFRYVDPAVGGPFRYDRDYAGFVPQPAHRYAIRPVPPPSRPLDLVYLTDAYGVYSADFFGNDTSGERSRLVYGGLDAAEVEAAAAALRPGGTFIAEFNTFGDPTGPAGRQALEHLLGLSWTGWTGRFFRDLSPHVEVPEWLVRNYEARHRRPWTFTGSGFALVNADERVVVLAQSRDVPPLALRLVFPDSVARRLGAANRMPYLYWFDIVVPSAGTSVEAEYALDLLPSGRAALAAAGIPSRFPGILRREGPTSTAYYFAGDFADENSVPWPFRARWGASLERLRSAVQIESGSAFYWRVYVPMMRRLLEEARPGHSP